MGVHLPLKLPHARCPCTWEPGSLLFALIMSHCAFAVPVSESRKTEAQKCLELCACITMCGLLPASLGVSGVVLPSPRSVQAPPRSGSLSRCREGGVRGLQVCVSAVPGAAGYHGNKAHLGSWRRHSGPGARRVTGACGCCSCWGRLARLLHPLKGALAAPPCSEPPPCLQETPVRPARCHGNEGGCPWVDD